MRARPTLRDEQAKQLRSAVLDAVIARLASKAPDDISMAEIAEFAGISLRTLYRYFPDRASLLQSAGEHLYSNLGVPVDVYEPQDISRSFREAARRLGDRPRLTRALVRTGAGQVARSGVRRKRVDAVRAALKPTTAGLDRDLARRATALITHLCSATSWVSVADESGLSDADAQAAVSWGIDTLVAGLQGMARHSASRGFRQDVPKEK